MLASEISLLIFEGIKDICLDVFLNSTKMNEDDANTIDAISQIKGKLTKYSQRKPDPAKVNSPFELTF